MKQKKAGKRFLSILLTTGMLFGALPAAVFAAGEQSLPFTDVKEADWFYDSVQYVYENQMMSGTGDDVFTPDAATTRGMIVTILYRMEGNPATDSDAKFTDVSAGQYYAEAAAWANEKNIVNGVLGYFVVYMLFAAVSILLISFDNKDFTTTVTAVIATMNNIGPGLGLVGPTGSFADFSALSKIVMSIGMLVGRLEFYPILILFSPYAWKRT